MIFYDVATKVLDTESFPQHSIAGLLYGITFIVLFNQVKNGIAPEIMKGIFELQNTSYNLRSTCNQFRRENMKTVHYGLQSVRYIGPKIWEL